MSLSAAAASLDGPPLLERIVSTQSTRTAVSALASGSTSAPGSIHAMSTTSASVSAAGTELQTPPRPDTDQADAHICNEEGDEEEEVVVDDSFVEGDMGEVVTVLAARARMGQVGTRSLQNLKQERAIGRQGRERSMTDSRPPVSILVQPPPVPQHAQPAPKPAKPSRGLSGFLRRLTGKSKKDKKPLQESAAAMPIRGRPAAPAPPTLQEARRSMHMMNAPVGRHGPTRQETAPIVSAAIPRRPAVRQHSLPIHSSAGPSDCSAPVQNSGPPAVSVPSTEIVPSTSIPQALVDPANVPLPPSPLNSPALSEVETLRDFGPSFPSKPRHVDSVGAQTARRAKQSPMLSFEGFDFEEEPTADETDEEADQVRPLGPLRIDTSRTRRERDVSPNSTQTLRSASSTETSDTTLQTPGLPALDGGNGRDSHSSESESSPERPVLMLAGSSPPRKAPIGTGMGGLDRKGSKWRKSVMGIQDTLNSTVTRKQTTRQPPSSHDAYVTQQRRMANNRVSCQPTLHSNASIAAGLTTIKDKKEQDMAETFFLS